jgi:plasmid stability protein
VASLTFRNIPEEVKRRFRAKAAAKGLSMEEAGRRLIIESVSNDIDKPRKSIGQMLFEMSRPGIELPILPRTRARIPELGDE